MHSRTLDSWRHDHSFGLDTPRAGEKRTLIVIALTATMMVAEIGAGLIFGSMALLADGLHMASHTAALGISVAAYIYVRRNAANPRWAFGPGKVNALAGFASAFLLAGFAFFMVWESLDRLIHPVAIEFNGAIIVAFLGLAVNAASVKILDVHDHDHGHGHGHGDHEQDHHSVHGHTHEDHNLRAAYLHVLADALTSLLAIAALLSGKFFGLIWLDPVMGIAGAVLVAHWSWGLLRSTSAVLLDQQAPSRIRQAVQRAIEDDGEDRIADLHIWSIGPGIYAGIIAVVTHKPKPPADYKSRLPDNLGIVHITMEVHHCRHSEAAGTT